MEAVDRGHNLWAVSTSVSMSRRIDVPTGRKGRPMKIRAKRTTLTMGALVAVVAVGAVLAAGTATAKQSALPRASTLYTSGTAWGPFSQFNPLRSSGNATGTVGLLYETLFRYDPLKDEYIPWLATGGQGGGGDPGL